MVWLCVWREKRDGVRESGGKGHPPPPQHTHLSDQEGAVVRRAQHQDEVRAGRINRLGRQQVVAAGQGEAHVAGSGEGERREGLPHFGVRKREAHACCY